MSTGSLRLVVRLSVSAEYSNSGAAYVSRCDWLRSLNRFLWEACCKVCDVTCGRNSFFAEKVVLSWGVFLVLGVVLVVTVVAFRSAWETMRTIYMVHEANAAFFRKTKKYYSKIIATKTNLLIMTIIISSSISSSCCCSVVFLYWSLM